MQIHKELSMYIAKQVAKEKTKEGIDAFITDFLNSDNTTLIEPFDDAKWFYSLQGNTFLRNGLCISAYYQRTYGNGLV